MVIFFNKLVPENVIFSYDFDPRQKCGVYYQFDPLLRLALWNSSFPPNSYPCLIFSDIHGRLVWRVS